MIRSDIGNNVEFSAPNHLWFVYKPMSSCKQAKDDMVMRSCVDNYTYREYPGARDWLGRSHILHLSSSDPLSLANCGHWLAPVHSGTAGDTGVSGTSCGPGRKIKQTNENTNTAHCMTDPKKSNANRYHSTFLLLVMILRGRTIFLGFNFLNVHSSLTSASEQERVGDL